MSNHKGCATCPKKGYFDNLIRILSFRCQSDPQPVLINVNATKEPDNGLRPEDVETIFALGEEWLRIGQSLKDLSIAADAPYETLSAMSNRHTSFSLCAEELADLVEELISLTEGPDLSFHDLMETLRIAEETGKWVRTRQEEFDKFFDLAGTWDEYAESTAEETRNNLSVIFGEELPPECREVFAYCAKQLKETLMGLGADK